MKAVPLSIKQAKIFIDELHRHHTSSVADKFRVGCEVSENLVGVVQVGRPVSRYLDDGKTLEVLRLCTDGTKGVCSFLYSRAARIAKELGYKKIITYILDSESGTSLKASGWHLEQETCGGVIGILLADREISKNLKYHFTEIKQSIQRAKNKDGQKIYRSFYDS